MQSSADTPPLPSFPQSAKPDQVTGEDGTNATEKDDAMATAEDEATLKGNVMKAQAEVTEEGDDMLDMDDTLRPNGKNDFKLIV